MANMVRVTLRIDEATKEKYESILNSLGLNMTTAMNLFARAVIRHKGIPFEIVQEEPDPFYNPYNLNRIEESRQQLAEGMGFIKTAEELGLDEED